ncbi:MAG: hypothetical protein ABJC63_13810 [Gemmatimonadales bacterium]
MADLYARQGYHEQALEVYRELATANPDDAELADRIRELSGVSETPISPVELGDSVPTERPSAEKAARVSELANEFAEPVDFESDFGFHPDEEATAAPDSGINGGSRHVTENDLTEGDQWDTDPWGAGFSSDDSDIVPFDFSPPNASPDSSDEHQLTNPPGLEEVAGPAGESLDAADESSEVAAPVALGDAATDGPAPVREPVAEPDAVAESEEMAEPEMEPEPEIQPEPEVSSPLPLGILNDAREEVSTEEMSAITTASARLDQEEASALDDDAVVAYSPQPPDEKDLAHYTPTGPTIREFFATLGTYRPPSDGQPSFTARAAVPELESAALDESETDEIWNPAAAEPVAEETGPDDSELDEIWNPVAAEPVAEETGPDESEADEIWSPAAPEPPAEPARAPDAFPLASDAFANLFPDSPVSDDDSRAAFALSGALSSQPAGTPPPTTTKSAAPPVADQPNPASGAPESEEDIRRFREWVYGLADS